MLCGPVYLLLNLIPYSLLSPENFSGGDYSGLTLTGVNDSGRKGVSHRKVGIGTEKNRLPLSNSKKCQNYVDNPHHSKEDWNIEIAVPKTHNVSLAEFHDEESEGSCVTKTLERRSTTVTSLQDIGFDYVHMDEKQECSSVSNLVTDNYEIKTISHDDLDGAGLPKPKTRNEQFGQGYTGSVEQIYTNKIQDRRSNNSIVTESGSLTSNECCLQIANEIVCIRKQLLLIESKQSNLMDQLQVKTSTLYALQVNKEAGALL